MLIKVYRDGPSRQRLRKGFVVTGKRAADVIGEVAQRFQVRGLNQAFPQIQIGVDSKFPKCIWLDTGAVWLHTSKARSEIFDQLARAAKELRDRIEALGGGFCSNAVFPVGDFQSRDATCGDDHFVETIDDIEREVFCNLTRRYTPLLIALSGRAAASAANIERLSSCRLSTSTRHFAARYFGSVSARHMDRVKRELRREEGVSRTDLLDVNPEATLADSVMGVHVRCIDAQLLLSSSRAHSILCEALLIRSRSLVRQGRRVGNTRQRVINRNRSRAIIDGLTARMEEDVQTGVRGANQGRNHNLEALTSATDAVIDMLVGLQDELRVLEVSYDEIACLILGISLRRMGLAGIRNENDFLRAIRPIAAKRNIELAKVSEQVTREEKINGCGPVAHINETLYPKAADEVRRWWDLMLRIGYANGRTSRNDAA
jgi:hypothetical protein